MVAFLTILIALVVIAVGIISMLSFRKDKYGGDQPQLSATRAPFGILVMLVGVAFLYGAFGWTEIGAGNVGVVTNFGRVEDNELNPGLQWRPPVLTAVVIMDTRVQNYNFGGEQGIEAFTKEQQPAYLFGVVNYHIDPQYASDLYQRVGTDYFEKVIQHQADAELKQDARLYEVDQITAKRDELARTAQARLTADVAQYHIVIDGIFISQIGLAPEYIKSVTDKQIAQQNVETAIADAKAAKEKAIGEANAVKEKANGDAAAITTLANAQRDANNAINASLTADLIQWQYVQKLSDNVQVMLLPSDQGLLFNLQVPQASPAP